MNVSDVADILGGSDDVAFPRGPDTLSGTTGEDSTAAMAVGAYATLRVGASSVRYTLRATAGQANQVATTSRLLPAGTEISWRVEPDTRVVYVQAGDGSTAYEVWVWRSSP
jgi:hypothetical protein